MFSLNPAYNLTFLTLIIVLFNVGNCFRFPLFDKPNPDERLNTTELIRSKGYVGEDHKVTTDDGYILSIQRIPYGINEKPQKNGQRPVVFLQHGLLDASSSFVINYPDQSLGFILADSGYDVWLGNMRGNTYGLEHVKLNPNQEEFWDFSWDEMAKHDLPSMVNYVLKTTNQSQLIYIGHSQGTLISFSQLGTNKELASKIKLFIGMGPVATVATIKSPIKILADIGAQSHQEIWYKIFGMKKFLPSDKMIQWIADKMCNFVVTDKLICDNILMAFCGPSKYMNQSRISVYTSHSPAGTSTKNVIHFAQMTISGKFQMYDYGSPMSNIKHYNQTEAPLYDLTKIQTPVALYWANNDWLADPKDIVYLKTNLPNIVDDYEVMDWDHLDFIWAINAKKFLYDRMINLMKKYADIQ